MLNKLVEDNHLLASKLVEAIERHPLVCHFYEWKAKNRIFLNEASMKYGGGSSTDAGSIGPLSQWWPDNAKQINRQHWTFIPMVVNIYSLMISIQVQIHNNGIQIK